MINLLFIDNILTLDSIEYKIESMYKYDDLGVNLHLVNDMYNTIYTVRGGFVAINDVLQTSADMIIETLSSNG